MPRKPIKTGWKQGFDDKPTSDVPRIKFSYKFSEKYLKTSNRILEIGCGTGSYLFLTDKDGSFGVDLQFIALKVAKRYCKRTEFIVASASNLPFRENAFDLVCIWGLLEELSSGTDVKTIADANRIMNIGAKLLLSSYNNTLTTKFLDPVIILWGLRKYDYKDLIELITDRGFTMLNYTIKGGWYSHIAIYIFYFYKHLLHSKNGRIKKFFDRKSDREFNSTGNGKLYTFIAAEKIQNIASHINMT
jgi:ubiquinone/menaquinone biosynthesis C-methylase UbiE